MNRRPLERGQFSSNKTVNATFCLATSAGTRRQNEKPGVTASSWVILPPVFHGFRFLFSLDRTNCTSGHKGCKTLVPVSPLGCSSGNEFSISSETCWAIRRNHETAELWITQRAPWGRHNGIVFILQQKPNKVIETLIFPGKPNHGIMNYKGAGGSQVSPINTVDRKGHGSRCHEQYFKADFNLNWVLWDPGC